MCLIIDQWQGLILALFIAILFVFTFVYAVAATYRVLTLEKHRQQLKKERALLRKENAALTAALNTVRTKQ